MMVPEFRLMAWAAVAVLPMAMAGSGVPEVALPGLAIVGLGMAVVLWDAWRARRQLEGIEVVFPPVVRLAKDRPGRIEVTVRNQLECARRLRIGLPWPTSIEASPDDLTMALPAGHAVATVNWECVARRRGHHRLSRCHLETSSPWGLWAVRQQRETPFEIRVYPNLLTERRGVGALFLNRGFAGIHAQRQVGKGRDFEKLRDYIAGDSYEDVHWKATAKRGRPVTKVYQIERTQEVYVVIDTSRLMGRESVSAEVQPQPAQKERLHGAADASAPEVGVTTVLERCLTAALVLGLAAERQGDLFGVITFGDRVQRFVRARNGRDHYQACRDALYALEPSAATPSFEEVCSFIRLRLRRRALLVFLTALDDPVLAEQFVQSVDLIRRQHLVLVNVLAPAGVRPMFRGPEVTGVEDLYGRLGAHLRWQELGELQAVLQRRGVRMGLLEQEELSAQLVSQYLSVKRTQRL